MEVTALRPLFLLEVHKLRGKGLNDSQIGKALGISRATVQRYLRAAAVEA